MKELSFVPESKDDIVDLKDPLEYFSKYWSESLTRYVVNMTNLYALENGSSFRVDADDLEMYLGILIRMGVAPLPRYDMYWSNDFRLPAIADHMARDKFKNINRFIHFADNDKIIRDRDDPEYDHLFKVRPLLHFIRGNCFKMFQEQRLSIDEQIVPFKGKTRLRQYVPNKPHKWGFKIISRNGTDGLLLSILRDGYGHYPEMLTANKRMRCKFCARLTLTRCLRCKVFLCIRPERNCFLSIHTQDS